MSLFCGDNKPNSVEEFFQDFVFEWEDLQANGYIGVDCVYRVSFKAFICDSPARAFCKGIVGHTSLNSCERCVVVGKYKHNRVLFNKVKTYPERVIEKLKAGEYPTHVHTYSPLLNCKFDVIKCFPLDYTDCVCLGVTKRVIKYLINNIGTNTLSHNNISRVDDRLKEISNHTPSDFARRPISFKKYKRWKATEFRQFLLYTSIVALKGVVSEEQYIHILQLSIAISIFCEEITERRNYFHQFAKDLIKKFVFNSPKVFGETFNVYNVHALLHLHEDITHYQCTLDELSAFKFENYLQRFKNLVRKRQYPLTQLHNRVSELYEVKGFQYKKLKFKIKANERDCCFMIDDSNYVFVTKVIDSENCHAKIVNSGSMHSFFNDPCDSKLLGIMWMQNNVEFRETVVSGNDAIRKVFMVPYNNGYVLIPLHHNHCI